ncbi:MAG: O-antigen ligase family protein [Pseudomonadota bacterium]
MPKIDLSFRLAVVCMAAISVGLPIAIISLSKALLLLGAIGSVVALRSQPAPKAPLKTLATPLAIVLALAGLAASLSWTDAALTQAGGAWAKHAKLLLIPVLLFMIRSPDEARLALLSFVGGQAFVLVSSTLLALQLPVPWAIASTALTEYAVFSSRLDQPIMGGVTAALCWHLRHLAPGRWGRHFAVAVALLALVNVFWMMNGRTGHVVLIALVSLAVFWELPVRWRLWAGAVPFALLLGLFLGSTSVRERMTGAVQEIDSYTKIGNTNSSSGERLNYWRRSIESMVQHPLTGSGVGSWNVEYKRLDQGRGPVNAENVRNPHQEYLLWGVEAGVIGMALLLNFFVAVYRDTLAMTAPVARATRSVLAALALACLVNSSLFDATIGNFFCVALGLLLALGWHTRPRAHPSPGGD